MPCHCCCFFSQLKVDGVTLSSSELSVSFSLDTQSTTFELYSSLMLDHFILQVLPKPGQHIPRVQTLPSVAVPPEHGNQEASSGAGELSDSVSYGETAVSHNRRKKPKV